MDRNGNIEMKRIFDILKSKVLLIMIIVLAFVMLGYMYSYYYVVPKYSSTETLLLIPNNEADGSMITSSDLLLLIYVNFPLLLYLLMFLVFVSFLDKLCLFYAHRFLKSVLYHFLKIFSLKAPLFFHIAQLCFHSLLA